MSSLREAAQQALEALEWFNQYGSEEHGPSLRGAEGYLRAALAEPVQEPVAWRWGYRSITTGEMDWRGYVDIPAHPNLRSPAIIMQPLYTAPPQQALTIERLRDALVASRIIDPAAVEDPDEYDDGVTLFRIEALHRRIT